MRFARGHRRYSVSRRSSGGNQHGYRCPSCGSREEIAVQALIWTALSDMGSDPYGRTPNDDHDWHETHDAACTACGWSGKVAQL
jgi:hypothetical protein